MRVLIELHEGRIAAPLLDNGLARLLTESGAEVLIVTPGAQVPEFRDRWHAEGLEFRYVANSAGAGRLASYERLIGRMLSTNGMVRARKAVWKMLGEPEAARRATEERALIDEWRPNVVVATHLSEPYGLGLVAVARQAQIPTVGNMVSWDNAYRPLLVRPDLVTCWSERNRDELLEMCAYRADEVRVIGAPAFDAYFDAESQWDRNGLCQHLGLDPNRAIILFATLGQLSRTIDETSSFKTLLDLIDAGKIDGDPQVVLRLHPLSRAGFFGRFTDRPDVVVSRYGGYTPWMAWTPFKDEIRLAGNLLRHADVCVSPGSTMTIEAAIFDTPTIMPVMNEYLPDVYSHYIDAIWINGHFSPIVRQGLLPIARTVDDYAIQVNRALSDPEWYQEQRAAIRQQLLGPLDGNATERLANLILESCR